MGIPARARNTVGTHYRQATNKIVGLSALAGEFLDTFF
jgi:hypothetical protein